MEANEAPEKIYLVRTTKIIDEWRQKPSQYGHNIEYIRKDAFIKKVANYLNYILYDRVEIKKPGKIIPSLCAKGEFIEDFKKIMEDKL